MLEIDLPEDDTPSIPQGPRPHPDLETKVTVGELRAAVLDALEKERREAERQPEEPQEKESRRKAKFGHAYGESRRLTKMQEEEVEAPSAQVPETHFWVDLSGKLLGCGRDWLLVTGRSWEHIRGLGWASLFTKGDCLRLDVLWRKFIADRQPFESQVHLIDTTAPNGKGVGLTLSMSMDADKFSAPSVRIDLRVNESEVATSIPNAAEPVHEAAERWGGLPIIGMVKFLGALIVAASVYFNLDLTTKSHATAEVPVRDLPAERAALLSIQERAHDLVVAFHRATTAEEKLPFVKHGSAIGDKMRDHYAENGVEPSEISMIHKQATTSFDGRPFYIMQGGYATGRDFLAMVDLRNNEPRLDWLAFAGRGDLRWSTFLEERSLQPVEMRVIAQPDDYYNFAFSDAEKYACFRIWHKDPESYTFTYVERQSHPGRELAKFFKLDKAAKKPSLKHLSSSREAENQATPQRVTLRLQFSPEGQRHSQALIDSWVARDWLDPFEQRKGPDAGSIDGAYAAAVPRSHDY